MRAARQWVHEVRCCAVSVVLFLRISLGKKYTARCCANTSAPESCPTLPSLPRVEAEQPLYHAAGRRHLPPELVGVVRSHLTVDVDHAAQVLVVGREARGVNRPGLAGLEHDDAVHNAVPREVVVGAT